MNQIIGSPSGKGHICASVKPSGRRALIWHSVKYDIAIKRLLQIGLAAVICGGISSAAVRAQEIPADTLVKSKVFYDIAGGQTYLIPSNSVLGRMPEAIPVENTRYHADAGTWGLQTATPPDGLAMVRDGPLVDKNFYDASNTGTGSVRALLVDPATGLVHYFAIMGVRLGFGRHVLVPVSAVDLHSGDLTATSPQLKLMDFFSKSEIAAAYPPAQIGVPIVATKVVLIPTSVVQGKATKAATGLGEATGKKLTQEGLLVGVSVVGSEGQPIGKVSYLAVDKNSGQVAMAFVAIPFLGPDTFIAVLPNELKIQGNQLALNRAPEQIIASPKYSKLDLINHYGGL